jgi:hypothetical protein
MSGKEKRYEEMFGEARRGKKRTCSGAIKRVVKSGLRRVREYKLHHSVMK